MSAEVQIIKQLVMGRFLHSSVESIFQRHSDEVMYAKMDGLMEAVDIIGLMTDKNYEPRVLTRKKLDEIKAQLAAERLPDPEGEEAFFRRAFKGRYARPITIIRDLPEERGALNG